MRCANPNPYLHPPPSPSIPLRPPHSPPKPSQALDFSGTTPNNLSRAILSNNRINSLACLEPHKHLLTLIVADNEITSLSALESLTQLRYLDASGNNLTNVEGLYGQPIQELHLSGNQINTLVSGGAHSGIGSLKSLQVHANP